MEKWRIFALSKNTNRHRRLAMPKKINIHQQPDGAPGAPEHHRKAAYLLTQAQPVTQQSKHEVNGTNAPAGSPPNAGTRQRQKKPKRPLKEPP